jgi:hypothetical protein
LKYAVIADAMGDNASEGVINKWAKILSAYQLGKKIKIASKTDRIAL